MQINHIVSKVCSVRSFKILAIAAFGSSAVAIFVIHPYMETAEIICEQLSNDNGTPSEAFWGFQLLIAVYLVLADCLLIFVYFLKALKSICEATRNYFSLVLGTGYLAALWVLARE